MTAPGRRGSPFSRVPALVAGAFLLSALFASVQVSDPDTWIHLAGGRLMAEQGRLPSTNTFSWVEGNHPWKNPEWLFDLALYFSWLAGGPVGLSLLQLLLVAGAFTLACDTARRRMGAPLPAGLPILLSLLLLALSASQFRFVPRPQLVSYLGLALLAHLWERKPRLLPLWTGLLGMAWGNAHPGVVFGLAAGLAWTASEALAPGRKGLRRAALATGSFVLGSLANPFLAYPYLYSFQHFSLGGTVKLAEFGAPTLARHPAFFAFAALALFSAGWRARRRDWLHPLLVLGFLPLAFFTVRIIPKLALLALPGMALTARELLLPREAHSASPGEGGPAWTPPPVHAGARGSGTAALALLSLLFAGLQLFFLPHRSPFGWGLDSRLAPSGAADLVEGRGLTGRIYNGYSQGGYLMWRLYPRQRVFQDSRTFAYSPGFLSRMAGLPPSSLLPVLDRYLIDIALLPRGPHGETPREAAAIRELGWVLVYFDGVSMAFVRPGSPDAARVEDLAFRLVSPFNREDELLALAHSRRNALLAELRRVPPERFLIAREAGAFGGAAFEAGDLPLAERFFRAGLVIAPRHQALRFSLGFTLERMGRKEEARREYRLGLREGWAGEWADQARKRLAGLGGG